MGSTVRDRTPDPTIARVHASRRYSDLEPLAAEVLKGARMLLIFSIIRLPSPAMQARRAQEGSLPPAFSLDGSDAVLEKGAAIGGDCSAPSAEALASATCAETAAPGLLPVTVTASASSPL